MNMNYCRGGTGQRTQGGARWNNYATCPTCGKRIAVNKNGKLRAQRNKDKAMNEVTLKPRAFIIVAFDGHRFATASENESAFWFALGYDVFIIY